jgi:hypothetical protein
MVAGSECVSEAQAVDFESPMVGVADLDLWGLVEGELNKVVCAILSLARFPALNSKIIIA